MTYLIYDIIIALLLLFAVLRGCKKGFVLTLCGFLAVFVAFIGATVVSNALAEPVSQLLRPAIEQKIQGVLSEGIESPDLSVPLPDTSSDEKEGESEDEETPALSMEDTISKLKDAKLYQSFLEAFQKTLDSGVTAAAVNAARAIAGFIARQIAHMILFAISFILVLALWSLLSHALDLAFKLPVLSSLNRWAGGAAGLFQGVLVLYIACLVLKEGFLPQEAIQNSYLLKWFCTAGPLSLLR